MTPIWNTAEKRNLAYLYETDSKYLHDVDFDSMLDQPGAVPPLWKRAAPAAAAAAAGAGFDAIEYDTSNASELSEARPRIRQT